MLAVDNPALEQLVKGLFLMVGGLMGQNAQYTADLPRLALFGRMNIDADESGAQISTADHEAFFGIQNFAPFDRPEMGIFQFKQFKSVLTHALHFVFKFHKLMFNPAGAAQYN